MKVIAVISYLILITCNWLYFVIPINGEVAALRIAKSYPAFFIPAKYAFYIWFFLYIYLGVYTVWQIVIFRKAYGYQSLSLEHSRIIFTLSCLLNVFWIISWSFGYIALALMINIIALIGFTIYNHDLLDVEQTWPEKLLIKLPFGIYYGWLTIITIANLMILRVSSDWRGFWIPETVKTAGIIFMIMIVAIIILFKYQGIPYCLGILWGYIGILVKHVSKSDYKGQYPEIIIPLVLCIIVLIVLIGIRLINLVRKGD